MKQIKFPVNVFQKNGKFVKRPATHGENWQTYEATDAEIRKSENVGVSPPRGAIVLDIDTYKGVTRADVERALNCTGAMDWDASLLQKTPSGGEHHLLHYDTKYDIEKQLNATGLIGLDVFVHTTGWFATGRHYTASNHVMGTVYEEVLEHAADWPELPAAACVVLSRGVEQEHNDDDAAACVEQEHNDVAALVQLDNQQIVDDITDAEVVATLEGLPGKWDEYDNWMRIAAALNHQYSGSDVGLGIFDTWSSSSAKYNVQAVKNTYRSFGKSTSAPFKLNSLIHASTYCRIQARKSEAMATLTSAASLIDTPSAYVDFVKEVASTDIKTLSTKRRRQLADLVSQSGYGRDNRLSASHINTSLKPGINGSVSWALNWVFDQNVDNFYHLLDKREVTSRGINAEYNREVTDGESAAKTLLELEIDTVTGRRYYPGSDVTVSIDGLRYANTYSDNGVDVCVNDAAVEIFKQHLEFLIPVPEEREYFLRYLAKVTQDVGCKIPHAVLLRGAEGDGKSYFCMLMQKIIGSNNVNIIEGSDLADQFNGWKEGSRLLFVEEVYVAGKDKYFTHNRMKAAVSNSEISIRRMRTDVYTTKNFTNYILLTNHKNAIPISRDDTRYYIIFTGYNNKDDVLAAHGSADRSAAYYTALYSTIENAGAIRQYLLDQAVPEGFGRSRASTSPSKLRMLDIVEALEGEALRELIDEHECEVFNSRIISTDMLWEKSGCDHSDNRGKHLLHELKHAGYERAPQIRVSGGHRRRCWVRDIAADAAKQIMQEYYSKHVDF